MKSQGKGNQTKKTKKDGKKICCMVILLWAMLTHLTGQEMLTDTIRAQNQTTMRILALMVVTTLTPLHMLLMTALEVAVFQMVTMTVAVNG